MTTEVNAANEGIAANTASTASAANTANTASTASAASAASAASENQGEATSQALTDEARAQIIDLCEKRAHTYELLSRLFRVEVDEETYASLKAARFPTKTGSERIDEGYLKIARYVSSNHDDPILELAVDYVRTFIGHGNTAYSAAYPFESVYTSEKRLLMQEARDEILQAYAEAGLVIAPSWKDPEDHVALELEYMQRMSARVAECLREKNDDEALELLNSQSSFLVRHLSSWVPMMTSDMRRFAKTELYLGLSLLLEGFLALDRDFLSDVVSPEPDA